MSQQYAELKGLLQEAKIENSKLFKECQNAFLRIEELEHDLLAQGQEEEEVVEKHEFNGQTDLLDIEVRDSKKAQPVIP